MHGMPGRPRCGCLRTKKAEQFRKSEHRQMTSNHVRNTGPMMASRRCGAKTRSGKACMSPAVSGKSRCRMHGGAAGSGAPLGNKNALKHKRFTRQAYAERRLKRIPIILKHSLHA